MLTGILISAIIVLVLLLVRSNRKLKFTTMRCNGQSRRANQLERKFSASKEVMHKTRFYFERMHEHKPVPVNAPPDEILAYEMHVKYISDINKQIKLLCE